MPMLFPFARRAVPAVVLLSLLAAGGCADSMRSTLSPQYRGKIVPVERIGVAGPGASIATQEFLAQGFNTVEIGGPGTTGIDSARSRGVPFVAFVDAVDTSQ